MVAATMHEIIEIQVQSLLIHFDHGMVVFPHSSLWSLRKKKQKKQQTSSQRRFCGQKCFIDERDPRKMVRLV